MKLNKDEQFAVMAVLAQIAGEQEDMEQMFKLFRHGIEVIEREGSLDYVFDDEQSKTSTVLTIHRPQKILNK